jgi:hypothetical protein
MFIVALAVGGSEGEGFIWSLVALVIIFTLMAKSGMIARPLSKEKYKQIYGKH